MVYSFYWINIQIKSEVSGVLDFLKEVYTVFGLTFQCNLSTRPEKFMGEVALWDDAEKVILFLKTFLPYYFSFFSFSRGLQQLAESLNEFDEKWKENPGDGAFYGPKIDITIRDALNRPFQCATIQLDFQLPIRFNLKFIE